MPYNIYAIASTGTIVTGITYKLRKGEKLAWSEWMVLTISLAVWGTVALGFIMFAYPEVDHGPASALMAIPLGLGLSEISGISIAAMQRGIDLLPETAQNIIRFKWGKR